MDIEQDSTIIYRFWNKTVVSQGVGGCWEWIGGKNEKGYGRISVLENGSCKMKKAHRVSYIIKHGPIPKDGPQIIMHTCDNPGCVNHNHLRLGTHADNMRDMVSKKRQRTGNRKLTKNEAIEHYNVLMSGKNLTVYAREIGVSRGMLRKLKSGETWAHVTQHLGTTC